MLAFGCVCHVDSDFYLVVVFYWKMVTLVLEYVVFLCLCVCLCVCVCVCTCVCVCVCVCVNGPFLRIFMRDVTNVTKIKIKVWTIILTY